MPAILLVGLGGLLGANARYLISLWAAKRFGLDFPYGTFLINVTGSAVIGFALTLATAGVDGAAARLFLATGFLGGYTTFSTFSFESVTLLRRGAIRAGIVYVVGSTLLGVAGCLGGILIAEWLLGWPQ